MLQPMTHVPATVTATHMLHHCWKPGKALSFNERECIDCHLQRGQNEISHHCVKHRVHSVTQLPQLRGYFLPSWLIIYKGNFTVSFKGLNPLRTVVCFWGWLVQYPRPPNWILIVIWGQWRFVQEKRKLGSSGSVIRLWFSGLGLIQGQHQSRGYHRDPAPALLGFFFYIYVYFCLSLGSLYRLYFYPLTL